MQSTSPKNSKIFSSLLKADYIVQWRNRRASLMSLLVPIIILISWKGIVATLGGAFALSSCITFGFAAVGLMGYSNTLARDREKGVFQRLRVTPASKFQIMASRLIVQMSQILFMTVVVLIFGYFVDKISLSLVGYLLTIVAAIICGSLYLGLGQAIAGLISSAETLNSVTRLVYFAFIALGALGELGLLGKFVEQIVKWSPYGSVKLVLYSAMQPTLWASQTWWALLVTLVYIALFAGVGIKYFKWSSN
jgi:ABC-2 type transport system permease protein